MAGEVTAGLAESNGSLPPGGWLTVTCRLTACTPGSAPGPALGIEYGKPLPFFLDVPGIFHYMVSEQLGISFLMWVRTMWAVYVCCEQRIFLVSWKFTRLSVVVEFQQVMSLKHRSKYVVALCLLHTCTAGDSGSKPDCKVTDQSDVFIQRGTVIFSLRHSQHCLGWHSLPPFLGSWDGKMKISF